MEASENPPQAVDAVLGKEYLFRGKPLKFSMACFFALEKAGIPLSRFDECPITASAVVLYAASAPKEKMWSVLRRGLVVQAAEEFASKLSPAEFLAGKDVVVEMISDYVASVATYASGDGEKNVRTVAEAS